VRTCPGGYRNPFGPPPPPPHSSTIETPLENLDELTHREREIFTLIATGYDNDQIAEKLGLAVQTVRNQVSTIYSKLGVKDRFEIIRIFNRNRP
jgi:DNA-binding NarL/FixJ family response regulator